MWLVLRVQSLSIHLIDPRITTALSSHCGNLKTSWRLEQLTNTPTVLEDDWWRVESDLGLAVSNEGRQKPVGLAHYACVILGFTPLHEPFHQLPIGSQVVCCFSWANTQWASKAAVIDAAYVPCWVAAFIFVCLNDSKLRLLRISPNYLQPSSS